LMTVVSTAFGSNAFGASMSALRKCRQVNKSIKYGALDTGRIATR
jgi:hypothetical protein